ncbi:PH domain-containing protein [Peribacillus asahii]|uniref:PH domain-containing protein n=1 Tax=Peribacillus asahii TaxID=228899 RepID=UPI00381B6E71
MSEPKRLHPIAMLLNVIKAIKDMLVPIIIVVVFGGDKDGLAGTIQLAILGSICLFVIVTAIIEWFRFTYRIEDGELRIESGVFVRKKRYIRFERIHSIDVSEGIIQRLCGLVKISIETAGGAQAEAVLSAIRKEEAERLNERLAEAKRNKMLGAQPEIDLVAEPAIKQESSVTFRLQFPELFLMSATSGAVGVVLSGVAAFVSQFDEMIPFERFVGEYEDVLALGTFLLTVFAFVAVLIVYMLATIGMMLKYARFTVEKKEDELIISRGLLEKRQLTIPLKKVQGIRIIENVVRQPLGYATVYLEYAGGSEADKDSLKVMLFPLVKKKHLQKYLEQCLPNYVADVEVKPLPARALPRYMFRRAIFFIPVIIVFIYFFRPWGYVSLVLLPISIGWAFLQYKAAGWNITNHQLLMRSRGLSRQTILFHKSKIQSIESKTSWAQQRKQLSSISALIKSGIAFREGEVRDVEAKDFDAVQTWFLKNGRTK